MTVNYFIKCPTCNTITRMRTPAGYIFTFPNPPNKTLEEI